MLRRGPSKVKGRPPKLNPEAVAFFKFKLKLKGSCATLRSHVRVPRGRNCPIGTRSLQPVYSGSSGYKASPQVPGPRLAGDRHGNRASPLCLYTTGIKTVGVPAHCMCFFVLCNRNWARVRPATTWGFPICTLRQCYRRNLCRSTPNLIGCPSHHRSGPGGLMA